MSSSPTRREKRANPGVLSYLNIFFHVYISYIVFEYIYLYLFIFLKPV